MSYKEKFLNKQGKFYNFKISEEKFTNIKDMAWKKNLRTLRKSILWGMFFEALIIATPICKLEA